MAITNNRAYLTIKLGKFGLSEDDIDMIFVENPSLSEEELNVDSCKLAIYNSMSNLLPLANISEGGYSVSLNIEALTAYFASLSNELGLVNPLSSTPVIRDRSDYW